MNRDTGRRIRWGGVALGVAFGLAAAVGASAQGGVGPEGAVRRLSLEESITLALQGNRDLARAELGLEVAEEQVREAWGAVYPTVDLTTSYNRNVSPPVSFLPAIIFDPSAGPDDLVQVQFAADNVWSGNIALEQPLFRASAFIGVGAAGEYRAFQAEGVRAARHDVVTRVRVLYYELLLSQEQGRLIERSVRRVEQALEETRALNRAGLASDYDVLRLEVEYANLEPQVRRAEYDLERTERAFVTELDLPPGTAVAVQGSLAAMDLSPGATNEPENQRLLQFTGVDLPAVVSEQGVEDLYLDALSRNAQVQQANLNVELREVELRLERAAYLPQVSLFAGYDIQAQQNGGPKFFGSSNERSYGKNVGVRVTVPIFAGFSRPARVDQRRAGVRSAESDLGLAEDRLRDEIRTVLEDVEEARLRAVSQSLAVAQAGRGYEIASAQYREGLGSQLELTDAEVALRQSEFNYAQAVFDYLSARARLDRAVGEVPEGL